MIKLNNKMTQKQIQSLNDFKAKNQVQRIGLMKNFIKLQNKAKKTFKKKCKNNLTIKKS